MNTIPTAKEFFNQRIETITHEEAIITPSLHIIMIEFAKLHLKAQQEAILENVTYNLKTLNHPEDGVEIDEESITSAYNINDIK